jgi:hypothetical protein
LYIDVRQCKGAGYFAEEGCFLVVGLDQGKGDAGGPEFHGESREAGAGAYVCYALGCAVVGRWWLVVDGVKVKIHHRGHRGQGVNTREQMAGCEKGFAEVAGYDFFWIADGG